MSVDVISSSDLETLEKSCDVSSPALMVNLIALISL